MSAKILITGATGNIGGKILLTILANEPETEIVALVRGSSKSAAKERLQQAVQVLDRELDLAQFEDRVRVVCGDIAQPMLGLSDADWQDLASTVTHIIHSAAAVQFTLPLECARQINCFGTRNVMELAQQASRIGRLEKVAHISTAYVCGDREGHIYEDEPAQPCRFSNSYEATKFEAEQHVRSLMPELPITIFRPSIVVGDSQTGRTLSFNVLYSPLRLIYRGVLKSLTCNPATPLDVVPLEYVARAITHIFLHTDSNGKIYHLVSGADGAPAVGNIVGHFLGYLRKHATADKLHLPAFGNAQDNIQPPNSRTLQLMSVFEPYLKVVRRFDDANTLEALSGSGISLPQFSSYFDTLLDYCFAVDWGKAVPHAA